MIADRASSNGGYVTAFAFSTPEITPDTGSPLGGDELAITGIAVTEQSTVTFGSAPALRVFWMGPVDVIVISPPGQGSTTVTVTTPAADGPATVATLDFVYGELILNVIRPDDLLVARFELVNLNLDGGRLIRRDPAADAFVLVTLPPQHISEAQFPANAGAQPGPPAAAVMAGESRLAFQVPPTTTSLSMTLDALLDWNALIPVPAPRAPGPPTPPPVTSTAIELPYRMVLTIDGSTTWVQTPPSTGGDVVELWRATAVAPSLRVTWSPELISPPWPGAADLGRPNAVDRKKIAGQVPALADTSLILSALGATTDLRAVLDRSSDLASWRQVVANGRDCYVRLVSRGALAPFGHAAGVIAMVERRPETATDGGIIAALMSTSIIVVTQPVVDYTGQFTSDDHPPLPFRTVRIATLSTPPADAIAGVQTVTSNQLPVQFHLVATDLGGHDVDLVMPLVFVPLSGDVLDVADLTSATNTVQASGSTGLRGQPVHFVPPAAAAALDGSDAVAQGGRLAVATMGFAVDPMGAAVAAGTAALPFLPKMLSAQVGVPGTDAAAAGAVADWTMKYADAYVDHGFDPAQNVGQVFAAVAENTTLGLPAEQAGGLVAPAMIIGGLSRTHGPVGVMADALIGRFDPMTALDTGAQLLGGLTLKDFLAEVVPADYDPTKLPALVRSELPTEARVSFTWTPTLQSASVGVLDLDLDDATLTIENTSVAYTDGRAPTSVVTGTLTEAGLTFLDAITLNIDSLTFTAEAGKKTHLTTGHNLKVDFLRTGDLAFLNPLVEALPPDGFADGPSIDVTANGVTVGYALGLPAIGVGILSIENLAFDAALSLPFTAPLGLHLNFSTREHPFLVTVDLIAGGGYFGLDVGTDGVRQIEGALELGANLSVDLLIVTAGVHVLAGFYFSMSASGTTFSAYLRIGGSVDLLGIVSVSIELYLALAYSSTHAEIVGTASLTLSVHLLFLSKTLTLSVQKHFAVPGASASALLADAEVPPTPSTTFDQLMTIEDWRAYRSAFVGASP